jgi:hypothetical protein
MKENEWNYYGILSPLSPGSSIFFLLGSVIETLAHISPCGERANLFSTAKTVKQRK